MHLKLEDLKDAMTTFSSVQCEGLTENCIVALENVSHETGCVLKLSGIRNEEITLNWSTTVNKNGYQEQVKFTEKGAEALSFFLALNYTDYQVLEEALIGTGVDYWLGYSEDHENYDPNNFISARLEISGILSASKTNTLAKRIAQKKEQTKASDHTQIPAYISIVEFSNPEAYFDKK